MRKNNFWLVAVVLCFFTFVSANVYAGDPAGYWSSSTGSSIKIWANMQQVNITVTAPNGASYKYNGWWTRFSDNFSYQVPNSGIRQCWFDRNNSNLIWVKSPNGSMTKWTRGGANQGYSAPVPTPAPSYNNQGYNNQGYNNNQSSGSTVDGTWSSNSGNSFLISTKGNQVFVTMVAANGARVQGIGRWLKYGSKFDYSLSGYPGTVVCTIDYRNPNVLYVVSNSGRNTWTRR